MRSSPRGISSGCQLGRWSKLLSRPFRPLVFLGGGTQGGVIRVRGFLALGYDLMTLRAISLGYDLMTLQAIFLGYDLMTFGLLPWALFS